jgi:excisionase family DNA binding protein
VAPDVTVPGELARPVARLIVLGLAEQSRRDGGLRPAPGLAALLGRLDGFESETAPAMLAETRWACVREAAAVIGCSAQFTRRLAASGRLIACRAGWEWLIDRQSAQDYARRRTGAA